ncbi:MAG: hypothetical protein VXZ72_00965 [Chlamydiota bacterium]|nr:hypothetical protein [Chlamydiota bacterium]
MIYDDDNIHEALEKVAAHQGKRNLGDFVGAVAGAGAGLTAAEKLLRKRLKLPGAAMVGLGGSLLGIEGSRSLRSGARRREMRRRGAEAQEYLRQVRKSKRLARGIQRHDAVKTANIQMVKMFLRQGLGLEAAVKRAYPTWNRARRAALVKRLRG